MPQPYRTFSSASFALALGAAAILTPGMAAANPDAPYIRYDGHTSDAVGCVQNILWLANHRVRNDRVYGPETRQGVLDVQRFFGLQMDGIVGPATGDALLLIADSQTAGIPWEGGDPWAKCRRELPTSRWYP